ncbi:MAG TPA: murein transglycosylase, partial [Stellaceae bacterium]
MTLVSARFSDLPGWNSDNSAAALAAFVKSCAEFDHRPDTAAVGPTTLGMTAAAWRKPCAAARATPGTDPAARAFFMTQFTPYLAGNNQDTDGL